MYERAMESGDNIMITEFELQTGHVTTSTSVPPQGAKKNTGQQGQQQQQQPQQTQGPGQAGEVLGQAELQTQGNDKFIYTCNYCNKRVSETVETRCVQYSIMIVVLFCIKN